MNVTPRSFKKITFFFRTEILLAAACVLLLGTIVFSLTIHSRTSFASSEVKFTDASAHGLSIVPASCPSTPDYEGQCDNVPPICNYFNGAASIFGVDCSPPPPPVGTCPNGAPIPVSGVCPTATGNCPGGYTMVNNQCVFTSCPAGYSLSNGLCVFQSCPSGFTLTGGQCVRSCPTGYTLQGSECVRAGVCTASYFCSGNDLTYQDASCQVTPVQTCAYGCSNGACMAPPAVAFLSFDGPYMGGNVHHNGHLEARPTLVRPGDTARVFWNTANAVNCSVTGDNGDVWKQSSSSAAGQVSKPLTGKTVFSLICNAASGATPPSVSESVTVNISPTFEEQ